MAVRTGGAPARGASFPFRIPQGRGWTLAYFVTRRVLWLIPVLFFVVTVTFFLAHLAPGSPWDREGRQLSPVIRHNLDERYGLDLPIWQQFGVYLWSVLHLNFGLSFQYQSQSVSSLLLVSWPYTATLGVLAFCVIVPVGITLGVVSALRQNTWIDYATASFSTLAAAFPSFVIGIFLIIVLGPELNKLTDGNFYLPTGGFQLDQHLIMPVATLSIFPTAYIARLTRSSTLEVMRQDYIRTAWAKGLTERKVAIKHIIKNSLIPVVTTLGPTFAFLVTGSLIVETVFAIPGIGRAFVVAVGARDYPMILAVSVLFAFIVAIANLVVDVAYVFIDPRVRLT